MVKRGGLDAFGKAVGIQEDSIGFREADKRKRCAIASGTIKKWSGWERTVIKNCWDQQAQKFYYWT